MLFWYMNRFYIAILIIFSFKFNAFSQEEARVIKVIDGDTYILRTGNINHNIRLLNVDAPEIKQNWGLKSKLKVVELIINKNVVFEIIGKDKYGRELVNIEIEGKSLDSILIANGWAWYYINYGHDPELNKLMKNAIDRNLGLWECGVNNVCPPWLFRHFNRRNKMKYCTGCN